jgi:hypothetical protein
MIIMHLFALFSSAHDAPLLILCGDLCHGSDSDEECDAGRNVASDRLVWSPDMTAELVRCVARILQPV